MSRDAHRHDADGGDERDSHDLQVGISIRGQ
jgi:hypothetical protein